MREHLPTLELLTVVAKLRDDVDGNGYLSAIDGVGHAMIHGLSAPRREVDLVIELALEESEHIRKSPVNSDCTGRQWSDEEVEALLSFVTLLTDKKGAGRED